MKRSLQNAIVARKAQRVPTPMEVLKLWRAHGISGAVYRLGACRIILAREPLGPRGELRWHLSISHPDRYPDWDEIAEARYQLVPNEAMMVMVLPPAEQYVNICDTCFHLHEVPEAGPLAETTSGIILPRVNS